MTGIESILYFLVLFFIFFIQAAAQNRQKKRHRQGSIPPPPPLPSEETEKILNRKENELTEKHFILKESEIELESDLKTPKNHVIKKTKSSLSKKSKVKEWVKGSIIFSKYPF